MPRRFARVLHVEANSKLIKQGDLTWSPQALDDVASEHAVTLLRVAEAGLVEDCPEVPPPSSVFGRNPALSTNRLDADRASLDSAAKQVSEIGARLASASAPAPRSGFRNSSRALRRLRPRVDDASATTWT